MEKFYSDETYKRVEEIVRSSGDSSLNIDKFIQKIAMEVDSSMRFRSETETFLEVAKINELPVGLVGKIYNEYTKFLEN